jgi:hypothetical protein
MKFPVEAEPTLSVDEVEEDQSVSPRSFVSKTIQTQPLKR